MQKIKKSKNQKMQKLNIYQNKCGFHTPKKTEQNLNVIRNAMLYDYNKKNVMDGSWHNDLTDSLHWEISSENDKNHLFFTIYLPNCEVSQENHEDEKFATFSIINEQCKTMLITYDIKCVIKWINSQEKIQKIEKSKI